MVESPLIVSLVKLILLTVVVVLAAKNLRDTWRDVQSGDWPSVRAKALQSRVVEAPVGQRRGFLGSHVWQVKWRYKVDGKEYTSKLTEPFPPTTDANAQMMASRVEKGDTFDVRYDPQNPTDSRLAITTQSAKLQLALRIFVYSVGIGVTIWAMLYL